MQQLPIFVNLEGRRVVLLGDGAAADAKRRLIERAGGICVGEDDDSARLAFVAFDDDMAAERAAARLQGRGLLVNVVDRPTLCDFTTPAIVDRSPVLVAIGTGGASAGLAKAIRQRFESILPQSLGDLARALFASRRELRNRFPDPADRRRALDVALDPGGALYPFDEASADRVDEWLAGAEAIVADRVENMLLSSSDPDDLTIRQARLLGQADTICHDPGTADALLDRARADAVRMEGPPPDPPPPGITVHLKLQSSARA